MSFVGYSEEFQFFPTRDGKPLEGFRAGKMRHWMCTLKRPLWLLYGEPWWGGAEWQVWVPGNRLGSPCSLERRGRRLGLGLGAAEGVGGIRGLLLGSRDKGFAGGLKVLGDGKRGLAEG